MEITKIPFSNIPQFSQKDKDYALEAAYLTPFFKHKVKIESFPSIIQERRKKTTDRIALTAALLSQYEGVKTSALVERHITALGKENTFTITTAHQPSLFTGPLYYIYKIISTIQLVRQLNAKYPEYNFVPVFVSGAEDHDFEEINHAHIFGKKLEWEHTEKGAVGTMSISTLAPTLQQALTVLGDSKESEQLKAMFEMAYHGEHNYGKAAFLLANALFQDYGLVVLDMNTPILKRLFIPYIKDELLQQISKDIVPKTQQALEEKGFAKQTHVRDINLFYLYKQERNRIEKEGDSYRILNTDLRFSVEALLKLVDDHPERFSPNVVLRPIYQELILPNLAYIGGGGEIAYWLERKAQFEHWNIPFPMLIRRNSVLWITKAESKKMDKLDLTVQSTFSPLTSLVKSHIAKQADTAFDLVSEKEQIAIIFKKIKEKALAVDKGLDAFISAEESKQIKAISNLEGRLHKAEKQKHEVAINQITRLKDKLYPKNGLQERYDNFIPFYLKWGKGYFDILLENLNPLKKGMIIIRENDPPA